MGCAGRRVDYIREASDEYREMQDMESACERRQRDRRRDIVNERGALSNGPTCNPAGVAWLGPDATFSCRAGKNWSHGL